MNTILFARSPPAGFFLCPKSSNKQGEELMNDIFENTETMKENEHRLAKAALNQLRTQRLAEGGYTDAVDDALTRLLHTHTPLFIW